MLNGKEFLTSTGERFLVCDDVAYVGIGDAIQEYIGKLLCLHEIKHVGEVVRSSEAVTVAEGDGGAVELYAPCDGKLLWINANLENDPRWLFKMRCAKDE